MSLNPNDTVLCGICTNPMDQIDAYTYLCLKCKRQVYWFQTDHMPDPDTRDLLQREWEMHYDSLPFEDRDAS